MGYQRQPPDGFLLPSQPAGCVAESHGYVYRFFGFRLANGMRCVCSSCFAAQTRYWIVYAEQCACVDCRAARAAIARHSWSHSSGDSRLKPSFTLERLLPADAAPVGDIRLRDRRGAA